MHGLSIKHIYGLIAALAFLCAITGCSPANPTLGYIGAVEQNRHLDPASMYKENLEKKGRDLELCLMEKGRIAQLQGDYAASRASFDAQVEILKQRELDDNTLPGAEINTGSVLVNDNMLPYKARLFEVEMLYLSQSFNYLAKGDLEGAVVEIRNADFLLNEAEKARSSKDFKEETFRNSEAGIQKKLFENQKAIQASQKAAAATAAPTITPAATVTAPAAPSAPAVTAPAVTAPAVTAPAVTAPAAPPTAAVKGTAAAPAVTAPAAAGTQPAQGDTAAIAAMAPPSLTLAAAPPPVPDPLPPAAPAGAASTADTSSTKKAHKKAKKKNNEATERAEYEKNSQQQYEKSFAEMAEVLAKAKSSVLNPYVLYVSGIIHEMNGELDDAYISYKKGLEVMPSNPYLQRDVVRLARRLNKTNDYDKLKSTYPELWKQFENNASSAKDGRLVVLYEYGWAPRKKEVFITLAAVAVAYPVYQFKWCEASPMLVSSELGEIGPTSPICYMNAIALRALKEEAKWRIIRQSARVAVKGGVFAAGTTMAVAGQNSGMQAAGIAIMAASAIYNNMSEKADLRSFMTLPENVQTLTAYMPEGTHKITFTPQGTQLRLEESVPVVAGKTTIVRVIQVGPRLIYQQLWPAAAPAEKSNSDRAEAQSNKPQEGKKP